MESFRKPLLSAHANILHCRYVPKPKPGVFRITKTVHNILQGVAKPDVRISIEEKQVLTDWIADNAKRYWLSPGGPLRPVEEGGADVIMVSLRGKNAKGLC
jgi:hypothetical protein